MEKKLYLLDGMALVYRSFYALNKNPRINSKGLNTSAILGFANTVCDLIKNQKPTHVGCAFDMQAPTFRHEKYENYKANRDAMPEEIGASLPYIFRFLDAMNIPILKKEGYEADDIIGTLAKQAVKCDFVTYMVTPDKDFGQLLEEKILMYRPGRMGNKDEIWGVAEILARFSIKRPDQVKDILGLWGDASDNIPGISGIGEKKATMLIDEFDTIENLIAQVDSIKNDKLRAQIKDNADKALFSKELATIEINVPIDFCETSLELEAPNFNEIKALFEELEFRTFAKRFFADFINVQAVQKEANANSLQTSLFGNAEETSDFFTSSFKSLTDLTVDYKIVETESDFKKFEAKIQKSKFFSFSLLSLNEENKLGGIAFCIKKNESIFIPFSENKPDFLPHIKTIFEDDSISKITYDLKLAKFLLKTYDIVITGQCFDTLIAHYLLESEMRHSLAMLCESYLQYTPLSETDILGKKNAKNQTATLPSSNDFMNLGCERADIQLQLYDKLEPLLKKQELLHLLYSVEMPLVDVLFKMETEGVRIDKDYLQQYSQQLQQEKQKLEESIYNHAGEKFNIASPKQLGDILFLKLKIIENPKQTATKQYSTGEEILTKVIDKHPIISEVLEYRGLSKLISTYTDALPLLISEKTGRVHTSYNQTVTATGRLSSTNPNLQNIPIRTERGREIRKAFIPKNDNYVLVSADYSQIELRIIAALSNDKNMLEAFSENIDIHTSTASKIYKVPIDEVTKDMRRNAKSVNFGIIYGISAFGLAEQLTIPKKEAAELIDEYFIQYPDIKKYIEDSIALAHEQGYAKTILGRRRKLNDINSRNANLKHFAERNAINMPIQGSAADMIKLAMIHIQQELEKQNLETKMILQVHDELVLDVPKQELEKVKQLVSEKMKTALELNVPLEVDISSGNNWLEAH